MSQLVLQLLPLLFLALVVLFITVTFIVAVALATAGLRDREKEWPAAWNRLPAEDTRTPSEQRIAS